MVFEQSRIMMVVINLTLMFIFIVFQCIIIVSVFLLHRAARSSSSSPNASGEHRF